MDTITLDELTRADAMMTRVDRKYLLRESEAQQLIDALPDATRVLTVAGTTSQRYDTTYFDTADLDSYFGAARKRRKRFKVRVRTYVDTGAQFLEVKTKGPRGVTVKDRVPYDDPGAWGFVAETLGPLGPLDLAPVMRNTYRRTTLSPPDPGRATVDRDLVWESADRRIADLDLVIVETKSGPTPSSIDQLLFALGHRPRRVSKFGCGMAALHPELPANNWHRTLTDYFERTPNHA